MAYKTIKWAAGAESISTGASANSLPISLVRVQEIGLCVQLAWTGTTEGTAKLQGSNNGIQWNDITGMTVSPAGSAADTMWVVPEAYYQFVRVVFTRVGGTGVLSGTVNIKGA